MVNSRGWRDDSGAVAVLTALILTILLALAAFVVDLAMVRSDIRYSQNASDAAALAGVGEINGSPDQYQTACETAWGYLTANLFGAPVPVGSRCDVFSDAQFEDAGPTCASRAVSTLDPTLDPSIDAPVYIEEVVGDYTFRIQMPVRDSDDQMTVQDPNADFDGGNPCSRMAISVIRERPQIFGGFAGGDGSVSGFNDSVARSSQDDGDELIASLVVLDRTGCATLRSSGAGSEIYVSTYIDPVTGDAYPGTIAVDTDPPASPGCNANQPVFNLDSGKIISEGDIFSFGVGAGGSVIDDIYKESDVTSGDLSPRPAPLGELITRKPIDHRYNCMTYPTAAQKYLPNSTALSVTYRQPIEDCTDGIDPYIKQLHDFVDGRTAAQFAGLGFHVYGDDPGERCNKINNADMPALLIPHLTAADSKWYFDCDAATIDGPLTITDPELIVFKGSVQVSSAFIVNSGGPDDLLDPNEENDDATIVVWGRNTWGSAGDFNVNGTLDLERTFVYLQSGRLSKGGNGTLRMISPVGEWDGDPLTVECDSTLTHPTLYPTPSCFEDLVVWQNREGTGPSQEFGFGGNGGLTAVGTIFVPNALINVGGSSTNGLTDAQFYGWSFWYHGGGTLTLTPNPERQTRILEFVRYLIR